MAFALIGLTVALTVAGQLLVKVGMASVGTLPARGADLPRFFLAALTNPSVAGGLVLAVAAALTWIAAVSRTQLSVAYPFMSLAIVLVLALSGAVLGEKVPLTRWVGVAIVCLGIVVASR